MLSLPSISTDWERLGRQLAVVTGLSLTGQNEIVYISPETEALGPRTGASCEEDRAKFIAIAGRGQARTRLYQSRRLLKTQGPSLKSKLLRPFHQLTLAHGDVVETGAWKRKPKTKPSPCLLYGFFSRHLPGGVIRCSPTAPNLYIRTREKYYDVFRTNLNREVRTISSLLAVQYSVQAH